MRKFASLYTVLLRLPRLLSTAWPLTDLNMTIGGHAISITMRSVVSEVSALSGSDQDPTTMELN